MLITLMINFHHNNLRHLCSFLSMKLIVISSPKNFQSEHQLIEELFVEGLKYFHLRKPTFTKKKIENFIKQIPERYYNRIVLHSHHALAEKYNLKGMHVKSHQLKEKLNHQQILISTSFHSLEEIEKCEYNYDYAFLSPVFNSISKIGYTSKFNTATLQLSEKLLKYKKIIALGGIDEDKINIVKEIGFDGIALLGVIWQAKNPIEKFKRVLIKI